MDTRGFSNRLLVDYRLLTYRGKHLASGLQVETIEWFSDRISPLSNFVWLCTWDYMCLWLQPYPSLKRVLSSISYLMTGRCPSAYKGGLWSSHVAVIPTEPNNCAVWTAKDIQDVKLFCAAVPSCPSEKPNPLPLLSRQAKPDLLWLWPLPLLCLRKHSPSSVARGKNAAHGQ